MVGGTKKLMAIHDIITGKTTLLPELGHVAEFAGCPVLTSSTMTGRKALPGSNSVSFEFSFIGADPDPETLNCHMKEAVVTIRGGRIDSNVKLLWPVPLLAYGGAVDVMSLRDCSRIVLKTQPENQNDVACLTADDRVSVVDLKTGITRVNYTTPLLPFQKWGRYFCLTADCYVVQ